MVFSLSERYKPHKRDIEAAIKSALIFLKVKSKPEIYLVPDLKIKNINRRFRKKNKPTNVLAFPFGRFPYPKSFSRPLGEIYLAPDYIKKRGENLEALAIHGLLHLLGYTHKSRHDRIEMERLEKKLLKAIK